MTPYPRSIFQGLASLALAVLWPAILWSAAVWLAVPCGAHPTFNSNSVVNAASFLPIELPGGNIARGSIFTVFGDQMGPPEGVKVDAFPLQRELAQVSVTVRQGNQTVAAIPIFANNGQVNAIMPSDAPLGEVAVFVTFVGSGGQSFFPAMVRVVPASFGIFTINGSGSGPAVVQNFVSQQSQPLNSTRQSARPGQVVTVWGTGLGAINAPDTEAPPVGDLAEVQVLVGNQPAALLYRGRSPCCAGVDQIVFVVPDNAPLGCYVPLTVRTAGGVTSNTATMSIAAAGGACDDPANPFTGQAAAAGSRLGRVVLARNALQVGGSGQSLVTDGAVGAFESVSNAEWFFVPAVSMPALGTCASFFSRGATPALANPAPLQPLDAGVELIVRGPNGPRSIPRTNPGFYASQLATTQQPPLYLDPGTYTVASSAGSPVGPFEAALDLPPPITWTNQGQISRIDRSQGIFLTWSGGDSSRQFVRILGISESSPTPANNVSGAFVCSVPLELGSFTVPPSVLANLPASVQIGSNSTGLLLVGTSPKIDVPNVNASGLDFGFVTYQSMVGKSVFYP
jgi:uncharacterized protein (TIGR03437 family)